MILQKKDLYDYEYNYSRLWAIIALIPILIILTALLRLYQIRRARRLEQTIVQVNMPTQSTTQTYNPPPQPVIPHDYRVDDFPTQPPPAYVPPTFQQRGTY